MDDQTRSDQQPEPDQTRDAGRDQELPDDEGQAIDDPVDDASEDSFPASDPPSFTGSTTD
jgi:hypothetical protein